MEFNQLVTLLWEGMKDSLYMTLVSSVLAYVIGVPLGIILVVTDKDGIKPLAPVCAALGVVVNLVRSVPFIILIVALIPFTRAIVGTSIGPSAAIVALVIGSAPYVARLVESSLKEVDGGIIEAAKSMGASTFQIIFKVMLPEAKPSLLVGAAIAVTTILSYTAMAGFVGGGGLGDIAIRYGYHRYQQDIMLVTVALLVVIVQILQETGTRLSKWVDKRSL